MQSPIRRINRHTPLSVYSPVSDIIDRHPVTVAPNTPVMEALALANAARSSCVLVTEGLRLVGMLAQDVVKLIAGRNLTGVTIAHVMSQPVAILQQDELPDIFNIISLLEKNQVEHLPVVDNSKNVVGIVSQTSISVYRAFLDRGESRQILTLQQQVEKLEREKIELLQSCNNKLERYVGRLARRTLRFYQRQTKKSDRNYR